jgi:DNA-binding PadR family transcriptional regulator
VDALFLPFRDPTASHWAAGWDLRWNYPKSGINWRSTTKASPSARKTDERLLKHLETSGYILRIQPRGKMTGVRLTAEGDDAARAMIGLPTLHTSHLASLATRPGRWVPECAVDGRPWGERLLELEDELLPLAVRAWVESNADAHRKVYYRVTPAGLKAAKDPPKATGPLPTLNEDLRDLYMLELQGALASLKGQPPPPREIGAIPLPTSWADATPPNPTEQDVATMTAVLWGDVAALANATGSR